jgi:hypothetical protein
MPRQSDYACGNQPSFQRVRIRQKLGRPMGQDRLRIEKVQNQPVADKQKAIDPLLVASQLFRHPPPRHIRPQ